MEKVDNRKQRTKCHFSASTPFPHGQASEGHKLSYRTQDEDQGQKLKHLTEGIVKNKMVADI